MSYVAFYHMCSVTLMLNHGPSQKCNGFTSKSLESSDIIVYWFTETVAFQCKLMTVHVLMKPPYNYLQMLASPVWPVLKDRMGPVYSPGW